MKSKRKQRSNRVASDDELYEYVVGLIDNLANIREVQVRARKAEDALTIAEFNECRGTDGKGNPTERVWSIRAV